MARWVDVRANCADRLRPTCTWLMTGMLCLLIDVRPASAQCIRVEDQKLLAPDAAPGDWFGQSLDLDGPVAIVGAYREDELGDGAGAAYIYRHDGSQWTHEQKLNASDPAAGDVFGYSVAIEGDVAVVGAIFDDDLGPESGSADVFRHDGTSWVLEQKLLASDGFINDRFGRAVDVVGDRIFVSGYRNDSAGADSGAVYVFDFDGSLWTERQKLTAADAQPGDLFGVALESDGTRLIVGAYFADVAAVDDGAAYVFAFDGASWVEEQKLVPGDGETDDRFGETVSLDGDVAIVGSYHDDDLGDQSGSAYLYRRGAGWTLEQKLLASDGAAGDEFGWSVSVQGSLLVVSAYEDEHEGVGEDSGSAYVFRNDGMSFVEVEKLVASDAAADDLFATWVAVDGDRVLMGSVFDDDSGENSGSVYFYRIPELALRVDPDTAAEGAWVTIETSPGLPFAPALIAIVAINGNPRFRVVAAGLFSPTCQFGLQGPVPPGLSGIDIDLQSFGFSRLQRVAASNVESLALQ